MNGPPRFLRARQVSMLAVGVALFAVALSIFVLGAFLHAVVAAVLP